MIPKNKIKEVIIVEGKNDTKKIKKAVDADTFETHGLSVTKEKLFQIYELYKKRGIIIFTDPDYAGNKIRNMISKKIPGAKHAYLKRSSANPKSNGSVGVEHASIKDIQIALSNLHMEEYNHLTSISFSELFDYGLVNNKYSRKKREMLCDLLHIGYSNGKQLYKKLCLFMVSHEELEKAMCYINSKLEDNDV